jgi:hypothetical protein
MQRDVLPVPDRRHEGPITYDAKNPDTSLPPIEWPDKDKGRFDADELPRVAMARQ